EPFASRVPGISHACGHDVHTAILLGAAAALVSAPELPGRVRLLFQPAEEEPGGAQDVIAAGGVEGVERVFGLHCDPKVPVGRIGTRVGPVTSACDMLELRVSACGPGRHNELSSDVVHALGLVATGLPALLARRVDPRSGTVLAWGAMDASEPALGTPREGVLRGTLRTGDPVVNAQLPALVESILGSLLRPTGVRFELDHVRAVPVVVNDPASTVMLQNAITTALGPHAVTSTTQSSGGEDFGWYLEHVPGSYARLGIWPGHGPQGDLHQPTFHVDERALPVGVRAMVHAALTALTSPAPL
ncbi:amidohydrolase, partial [Actinosynnema sp. NPDC023658]|uniref:amidohydrolase n=1 Tax=Actinosynnema sp. NPDC023658 TaxID=3155465 RepID=UPI0033D23D6F